jgi:predicted ATPase
MSEAREYVERATACSDFTLEEHRVLAVRHWVDPRAMALAHAAVVHSVLGQTQRALQYCREARELAERIGHAHTQAYVLLYAAVSCQLRGDARGTLELAEECHALAREHWFRLWTAWSALLRGWALARLGRPQEGLALMHQWLGRWRMAGLRAGMPQHLGLLAEVHLLLKAPSEALRVAREGLKWVESMDERYFEAELHRIGAEAQRALGNVEEAREGFLQALRTARAQGALEFERHTLRAMGQPSLEPDSHAQAPSPA